METADSETPAGPPNSAVAPAVSAGDPAPGAVQMLDPRLIPLDRAVGAITGVVISIVHFVGVILTSAWPWWALLLIVVTWVPMTTLLAWLALKWPAINYRHWRYRVGADGIEIWSGVVWRQLVFVPRSRVQHIDVSQGPIERSYGLATLSIHTAGTQHSKVDLPGLDHAVALGLRDALLPKDVEPAV